MSIFSVNSELCRKDAICIKACPVGVIAGAVQKLPRQVPGTDNNCIACGHCMAFCPTDACRIEKVSDPVLFDSKNLPEAEAVSLLCKTRRSTRYYRKKPVEKEVFADLLDTARYAPSAKNNQFVRWLAVYEREKINMLGDLLAEWMKSVGDDSPAGRESAGLAARWGKGRDVYFREAPHLVMAISPKDYYWATVDATIALTYLELYASSKGLGTCWAGYFVAGVQHYKPLQEALGLTEDEVMPGCFMLGYPTLKAKAIPARNEPKFSWL